MDMYPREAEHMLRLLNRIAEALEKMAPSVCAHGENTPCPHCLRDAIMDGIGNALPVVMR